MRLREKKGGRGFLALLQSKPHSMQAAAFMRLIALFSCILTTAALHSTDFNCQLPAATSSPGCRATIDKFPRVRSTSRFGELLWRAKDAARARNALDALGGDPPAQAQTLGDGVLAARQSPELVERRISARRDLLAPKRSPDFEGVLLWECADAISKTTPAATKSACSTRMRSRELH